MTSHLKYIKTIYRIIVLIVSFIPGLNIKAQDMHFSQFFTTPLMTNPANTGISGDNLRFANNYRNQWAKVGEPYKTFYTSLDQKLSISEQSFGLGGFVIHDQSSAYNLTANEFLLSLSYSKIINNNQFSFGLQPGVGFKSFDMNGLTFGNQFDQVTSQFNSELSSSESNLTGNLHYFDLNVGVFWRTLIRNVLPSAGLSVSHILRPVVTFSTSSQTSHLPMKVTFNGQVVVPVSSQWDITPCLLFSSTPGVSEFLLGGTEEYKLKDLLGPVKGVYVINMFRLNPFSDVDAMILGGGIKFSRFDLGLSYDINLSPLSKSTSLNGAFELSLVFIGNQSKKAIKEPCYIY